MWGGGGVPSGVIIGLGLRDSRRVVYKRVGRLKIIVRGSPKLNFALLGATGKPLTLRPEHVWEVGCRRFRESILL